MREKLKIGKNGMVSIEGLKTKKNYNAITIRNENTGEHATLQTRLDVQKIEALLKRIEKIRKTIDRRLKKKNTSFQHLDETTRLIDLLKALLGPGKKDSKGPKYQQDPRRYA